MTGTRPEQPTILIVENNPAFRAACQKTLTQAGFRVLEAETGAEGFELFASERPDLILSEVSLPDMHGFDLLKAIRRIPLGRKTPFILQTSRGTRHDTFVARSLGADDYITKPISSAELVVAVQARLERFKELKEDRT